MSEGPYTTITVAEYAKITATHRHLRRQIQRAREFLEQGKNEEALNILKFEESAEHSPE